MIIQIEFTLRAQGRGFHLITDEIMGYLPELPDKGLLHLFIKHTSAALTINENADADVQLDLASSLDYLVREREPYYRHMLEGNDDMPVHVKSSLIGSSVTIPIAHGRLNMGTWQGLYLCEFRNRDSGRKIVATVYG